ncbi:MAG: hypothetical protein E7812_19585 [Phenylobacterium sp.]|nr:MAG: hypothetical protein E7812_19585 [Phenylobacterium sp.]
MTATSRRSLLLLVLAASLAAGPVLAAQKVIDPKRVFPYLPTYWKLAPGERNRFVLAYVFKHNGQPLAGPMWILMGQARNPIPLADGRVTRLPTAAELDGGKLEIALDEKEKVSVNLQVEALIRPAAQLDARELAAAIDQATAGEKKVAGLVGFMAPKLTEVVFVGVASGEAQFVDGHRAPLPLDNGAPAFTPAKFPGAVKIVLPKPPTIILIG